MLPSYHVPFSSHPIFRPPPYLHGLLYVICLGLLVYPGMLESTQLRTDMTSIQHGFSKEPLAYCLGCKYLTYHHRNN